jgi:hypothetical protein
MKQESEYPSSSFTSFEGVGNAGPDVRGSVFFPGASCAAAVDGWIIGWEFDGAHALIVLCFATEGTELQRQTTCA